MNSIIVYTVLAVLCFSVSAVMLLVGFLKRRRLFLLISLICFMLFCIGGGYGIYFAASKASHKIHTALQPRKGEVIYEALFSPGKANCVQVLETQDQIVPRLDIGIFLHFRLCRAEVARIVKEANLTIDDTVVSTQILSSALKASWIRPDLLGDSVVVWKYENEKCNNWRTLFVNIDMSEAFYEDIAD